MTAIVDYRAGNLASVRLAFAALGDVTHCYERPFAPGFPFNLFAMIHARSMEEAKAKFAALEAAAGLSGGVMLVSTKEYKKPSMAFFA